MDKIRIETDDGTVYEFESEAYVVVGLEGKDKIGIIDAQRVYAVSLDEMVRVPTMVMSLLKAAYNTQRDGFLEASGIPEALLELDVAERMKTIEKLKKEKESSC